MTYMVSLILVVAQKQNKKDGFLSSKFCNSHGTKHICPPADMHTFSLQVQKRYFVLLGEMHGALT